MSETGIRTISQIAKYKFSIPKYQRGYRWTETNVTKLLEDIYENKLIENIDFSEEEKQKIKDNNTYFAALRKRIAKEDEITAVWSSKQEYAYCIQPLVVAEKQDDTKSFYTVIDGQQRLTTISIMLAALQSLMGRNKDENTSSARVRLSYLSRVGSEKLMNAFYDNMSIEALRTEYSGNIDFDYMIHAYEIILEFYKNESSNFDRFFNGNASVEYYKYLRFVLLQCVQFIWYDASEGVKYSTEQKVFANFNTGKLPLTNAELIKAIFMNPANFGETTFESARANNPNKNTETNKIKDRQISIAEKWDSIETTLHDSDFWAFVPNPNQYGFKLENKYQEYNETRIEILFDLLIRKKNLQQPDSSFDEFAAFNAIDKWISDELIRGGDKREIMDRCWSEVKSIYSSLRELYEDKENRGKLYNLLGVYIYASYLRKSNGVFYTSLRNNNEINAITKDRYLIIFDFFDMLFQVRRTERKQLINKKLREIIFGSAEIESFIKSIKYSETENDKISICLLLYNILKLNQVEGAGSRFNFLQFAQNTWQREHIFATQNEGVTGDGEFHKVILDSLLKDMDSFDNEENFYNSSYIRYLNYRDRGEEGKLPEMPDEQNQGVDKGGILKEEIAFLKNAAEMHMRYKYIEEAQSFCEQEISLNEYSRTQRTRLVDAVITYCSENKFFFSESDVDNVVNKALGEAKEISDLTGFKDMMINKLKETLILDATTQITNIFKDYDTDSSISPHEFLMDTKTNQDTPYERFKHNLVRAYRRKIEDLVWFSLKDKDAILEADDKSEEFTKMHNEWKMKKKIKTTETTETEDDFEAEDDLDSEDVINSEKQKITVDKLMEKLNLSNDDDLLFVINAIKLNKNAMQGKINKFFGQGGSYCTRLADDSMGNMALLSGSDNAGVSNSSYAKKSELIYEKSKIGSFIPLETVMVFTGAYSEGNVTVKEWLPQCRLKYLKEIILTLRTMEEK